MERKRLNREERRALAEQRKARKKRVGLIVLCVFLAIILIAMIVGVVYIESLLGLINRADDEVVETMSQEEYQQMLEDMAETLPEDFTGTVSRQGDIDWGDGVEAIENSDKGINILLIGQDRREGETGRTRSDTIILCTVNKVTKTMTLTSFMRDLYVQIPGYHDQRINVPYVLGGMNLLDQTLKVNFGVQVDGNVEVDFFGFIDIVNLMGGVEMELTAAEADYMNQNVSSDVDDGSSKYWDLRAGVNQLTGSQALSYARMRKVGNGDYERTTRQRKVIAALMEKAKTLSLTELNLLLKHALPMITTDLEDSEIMGYAADLLPMLSELTIVSQRIPADGCYEDTYVEDTAVLLPDLEKNRNVLREIMRTD